MEQMTKLDIAVLYSSISMITYLGFKRYEFSSPFPLFSLLGLLPSLLSLSLGPFIASRLWSTFASVLIFNALLGTYVTVYRLSPWHPLAKFPGPVLPRVSKWYLARIAGKGNQHTYIQQLHVRYGDVVRVGPNELSFRDASAIPVVLGTGGLPKGPAWDNRSNPPAVIHQRNPAIHAIQRKPWNRAFTGEALKEYETLIAKRARQLVERVESLVQTQAQEKEKTALVDMALWFSYFSFGGGFELMRDGGDIEGFWKLFEDGLNGLSTLVHVNWAIPLLRNFPGMARTAVKMLEYGRQCASKRMQRGATRKDLFYYLSGEDGAEAVRPSLPGILSNGFTAVLAGSDTTATTLTTLLYHLVQRPTAYKNLQEEIDREFPAGVEPLDVGRLIKMPWLNACINEALRMHPPVPSGSQRSVARGAGPKVVGDCVIPESTQLYVHTHSVHRDPRNFSHPDAFLPERWFENRSPDIPMHNLAAFIPFSHGPTICAGKPLALLELRIVGCWVVQRFDFKSPAGTVPAEWERTLQDHIVLSRGALKLEVTPRY
ncbi:high nitrogen upregulated cytochrome P450 monooxygenase 2 [Gloeopeniophorella convolvens]|nr:high nitrogen upregulated cytochrome P450 monooxygenase 2 [Gloeopeniophorella convolvens]